MKMIRELGDKFEITGELFSFLWARKLWWMMPVVVLVVFFGLLIGFGSASGMGPFVYTLF